LPRGGTNLSGGISINFFFDWATSNVAKPCVVDVHDGSSTQMGSTMMMSTKMQNPSFERALSM
jgi:hypothetical protein